MTDRTTRTSNDPQRPPRGPAGVSPPSPRIVTLAPEVLATLDRIATAFETIAAALVPDDGAVEARYCGVPLAINSRRVDAVPLVCTRFAGHEPGHVARDEDGVMLACETCTGRSRETTGMVCQTCHTDYAAPRS